MRPLQGEDEDESIHLRMEQFKSCSMHEDPNGAPPTAPSSTSPTALALGICTRGQSTGCLPLLSRHTGALLRLPLSRWIPLGDARNLFREAHSCRRDGHQHSRVQARSSLPLLLARTDRKQEFPPGLFLLHLRTFPPGNLALALSFPLAFSIPLAISTPLSSL